MINGNHMTIVIVTIENCIIRCKCIHLYTICYFSEYVSTFFTK